MKTSSKPAIIKITFFVHFTFAEGEFLTIKSNDKRLKYIVIAFKRTPGSIRKLFFIKLQQLNIDH
ncbi:hypothetical protein C0J52_00140 [Blattella germanica]|nr:hypothetical protein C0J52_00140 [Blattella germanica]